MQSELFVKTMKTMGILVGACVAFTGLVTMIALLVVGHAVGPRETVDQGAGSGIVPASKIAPQVVPAKSDDGPAKPPSKADLPTRTTRAI